MAILVNKGMRGFVLKEGLLAPGQQIIVDQETAEKLSRTYPKEIMLIDMPKVVKPVLVEETKVEPKVEPKVETVAETAVETAKEEKPKAKRGRKPKAKKSAKAE